MPREMIGGRPPAATLNRVATIVALAVVLSQPPVRAAHAGTYAMRNCNVPGHAMSLLHPWQPTNSPVGDVSMVDACATGGGWAVNLGGARQMGDGYGVGLFLEKPTGPRSQISFDKLTVWYSARLAGSGQRLYFDGGELRPAGFDRAVLSAPPGSENVVAERDLSADTTHVQLAIRCGFSEAESSEPCSAAHGVPLLIRGIQVTLREDVTPIVLRVGGSLLEGGPQSGLRTVTYSASDPQSGLSKIEVLLGETLVATNDLTIRCSHSDFTVCPAAEDGTLPVDTRTVPNGSHRLTLRVHDAAGNVEAVHGERVVMVDNEPGPASTAASADTLSAYTLSARFNGSSRSTLTVPYGRRVVVRGRLARTAGTVPPGTRIEVLERGDQRGAREISRASVKTKPGGSFAVVLNATRPSRTVRLAYRQTTGGQVVSPALKLRVRAASTVQASLRGRLVRFSGRVLSRPVPRVGKRVVMEGRSPGSAWTAFKTLRTDRAGRFSGTYRLRVRRPGVMLKIRAIVPREASYGYLGSRSRAATFRVR